MTERANTVVGQGLIDDFGCRQDEIGPMTDSYLILAYQAGFPPASELPVGIWLRQQGHDPDDFWRAALVRVRGGEKIGTA